MDVYRKIDIYNFLYNRVLWVFKLKNVQLVLFNNKNRNKCRIRKDLLVYSNKNEII